MNLSNYYESTENEMHRDIKEEILFFHKAANGDIPAIRKNIAEHRFRDSSGVGILSVDPILNLKYHMVITTGILTRICIQQGLEPEKAFRLSDFFIRKLDHAKTEDDVELIHDEMLLEFTGHMRLVLRDKHLSRCVNMSLDYIYAHLCERITLKDLADHTKVSTSFLSRTFSAELGMSISDYIREKKIEMAQDLLVNSDMSILDISCYLSFSSQSHFIQSFKLIVGTTPKKYRSEHRGLNWSVFRKTEDHDPYSVFLE